MVTPLAFGALVAEMAGTAPATATATATATTATATATSATGAAILALAPFTSVMVNPGAGQRIIVSGG
ncbi:MAG: hypothetical protein ACP5QO_16530, partial [Clostridia bacterium]